VFLPHAKDAIPIRNNSAEMFVLQQLRDEAHRFAISFHRNSRRRLTLRSALSDIPGIGPGRQRQLLRHFGSVKRVREASVEELAAVAGMTRTTAEAVFTHWAKQPLEPPPATDAHATSEELAIDDAFTNTEGAVVEMTDKSQPARFR
jgi:excinuclease ABC subunit C